MDYLPLEIASISAEGLKKVNLFTKMDVYISISISGTPYPAQFTPIAKGRNPNFHNYSLNLNLVESAINQQNLSLIFVIKSRRFIGDREIGRVHVPLREILGDVAEKRSSLRQVSYQVRTPSGKAKGMLTFSYKFGEKIAMATPPESKPHAPVMPYPPEIKSHAPGVAYPPVGEPVMAYPPGGGYYGPPPAGAYGYAPPPGYGYPPAGAYGYAPPPQGYGYTAVPQKKNRMGLGLGLGAGLLGGMLLGDMVSDMGEASYDAGYDAAMDEGVGF